MDFIVPEHLPLGVNYIHPSAIIGPDVKIGHGNFIGPNCLLQGRLTLGHNNRLEAFVSIGAPAEHRDHFHSFGEVLIGSDNVFREFVTINSGTTGTTKVLDHCVMLRGSHLGHDAELEWGVNVSCNVLIGGHTRVDRGANLGLGAILHQQLVIGAFSMLGMGTVVTKQTPIEPGFIYVGNPARKLKENIIGLERHGITPEMINQLREEFSNGKDTKV